MAEAFASNYVAPVGPMVEAFEREFAARVGLPFAVALSSGTAAMHLSLIGLGVGRGDTVYCSSLTFIASIAPAVHLGAQPVFIDSDEATWNMDPDLLAEALAADAKAGRLPKAVVAVDLYGQCCDLDRIQSVCAPYGVPVVADAAESLGATYKGRSVGVGAAAAVYSFNGNKIITTSGGGMLASDSEQLIRQARFLATQAREPAPHYEHAVVGYNYRLSNILAAIGRGQLGVLDERVAARRRNFERYAQRLECWPGIRLMPEAAYGRSNRWLTVILVDEQVAGVTPTVLREALEHENIEARPVWKPMHLQPVFQRCQVWGGRVSEALFRDGLCLPSGSALSESDIERVAAVITGCLEACR